MPFLDHVSTSSVLRGFQDFFLLVVWDYFFACFEMSFTNMPSPTIYIARAKSGSTSDLMLCKHSVGGAMGSRLRGSLEHARMSFIEVCGEDGD